jgi:hypothetical protein
MSTSLGTWIAEQRAVCAVQKQRWEGVAPERMEEACSRLEVLQLVLDGRESEIAMMRAQIGDLRRELDMLRRHTPNVTQAIASGKLTGEASGQSAEAAVLPFFLNNWRTRPWTSTGGIALSLEGAILTASPAMQGVYERCIARLAGTTIALQLR